MSKRQAFQFLVFMIPLLVSAQPSFTVTSAVINGNITSTNTEDIRDLGFSGIIGTTPLNVYGDTIICGNGSEYDRYYQVPPFPIYGANSAAFPSKTNKQSITDFNLNSVGSAQQFCPFNSMEVPNSDYGMGITNVVATSSTEGILYFLKNYRPNPAFNDIIGAGVAVVDISGSYPTCTRTSNYWWDAKTEPFWGDHGALLASDGYVYLYGGANGTLMYDGLYVARVPLASATTLSTYQYWNGEVWSTARLENPTSANAILADLGQGQLHYNPHLNAYVYIYTSIGYLNMRVSSTPQGPFGPEVTLFQQPVCDFIYSPTAELWRDTTGKTLTGSYTCYPNILQSFTITFA